MSSVYCPRSSAVFTDAQGFANVRLDISGLANGDDWGRLEFALATAGEAASSVLLDCVVVGCADGDPTWSDCDGNGVPDGCDIEYCPADDGCRRTEVTMSDAEI